jgi:hypothetical protein
VNKIIDSYSEEQFICQLEKRKGGYFYITISADVVNQFKNRRLTRFLCTIDKKLTFQCGLNHLGDGNFFIILGSKNLKVIDKQFGDNIFFELAEDPNPLGVDMPEILEAVLEQDKELKATFDSLTLGKKRNVIHSINKIKDTDKQIKKTIQIINESTKPRPKRPL